MKKIRAIETHYKGYRFRSRLEARWAVYFDTIGIDWEYETEGYDLGKVGWYLPDFWLPQVNMWAEVKGKAFTKKEKVKCEALVEMTGNECLLLEGMPEYTTYFDTKGIDYLISGYHNYFVDENRFYSCTEFFGNFDEDSYAGEDVKQAINNARSARFEHGEKPRI